VNCPTNTNSYQINIPGVPLVTWLDKGTTRFHNWTPTVADSDVLWSVRAVNGNGVLTARSNRRVCVEGGAVVGAWTACNDAHQRTKTCTETCGTNDCTALGAVGGVITEDCVGTITGTLFDASDMTFCPGDIGTNPIYAPLRYGSQPFDILGSWPVISLPTSSNVSGNYSESVYASAALQATYTFDFTSLISSGRAAGVKLQCQSAVATVTTQGQVVVKDIGFWRVLGGWWQAVGGSVHGENGIRSEIPSGVPTEQSLILPDTTLGNRVGFLSYGLPRPANMLGTNPNAVVSTKGWEKESKYNGLIYNWDFYNTRFNLFSTTDWNGVTPITYDEGGRGYQIFEKGTTGAVNDFSISPVVGGQKIIFLVNGDLNVTSDITVSSNSFLAIIARGTITFGPDVTVADGWFVADNIAIPCKDIDGTGGCDGVDDQFLGNGSFVGWSNINLSRNLGAGNNTMPSEKFTYRQDLFNNAPDPVKIYPKIYKPFVP
jgi:hypothetical protein